MAAPVPAGTYYIVSVLDPNTVADLSDYSPEGNIIGFPNHAGPNQQVRIIVDSMIT
jgi:hypothetical protein